MKRYWIAGTVTLLVSIAGFWLPSALLEWQDETRLGKSETEAAEEVVLTAQTEMTLSEKLQLMTGDTVNALPMVKGKNYSRESIEEKMQEEIRKLEELGILNLDGQQLFFEKAEVQFLVDTEDAARSLMIWVMNGSTEGHRLTLVMDDETGKILSIGQTDWTAAAVTDWAEATDTSATYIGEDRSLSDLKVIAEKWGEYLGCTLIETRQPEVEEIYPYLDEEMKREVEAVIKYGGLSEEEAYWKVYEAFGFPAGGFMGGWLSADYQDEGGMVTWLFHSYMEQGIFSMKISM